MSCSPPVAILDGVPAGGAATFFALSTLMDSFDFTNMGNINLTTGPHVLTSVAGVSLSFTALQQGTTFDILAGTGMRFVADATNTQYHSTIRTAANLAFQWLDFFNAYGVDARRDFGFAMYMSTLTIPSAQTSPAGAQLGVFRPANTPAAAGADWRSIKRSNAAGTQAMATVTSNVTDGDNYATPAVVANTKALYFGVFSGGLMACAGDWDTGTQTWDQVTFPRQVASQVATSNAGNIWRDQGANVTMAFSTGNTNANMVVTTTRLAIFSPF